MTIKGPESSRQPGISKNDPLYFFLNKSKVRVFDPTTGEAVDLYQPERPFANLATSDPTKPSPTGPTGPTGSNKSGVTIIQKDLVDLSDIENVSFEEYLDPITKIVKIRAYIKVRNTSLKNVDVSGVDVRLFDDNSENTITKQSTITIYGDPSGNNYGDSSGTKFIVPTPSVPVVKFDRTGSAVAWGWNNISGLGSYSSVYYEWIISKTNKTNAATLDSGTKQYTASGSLQIGNSGVYKKYRVSSGQGDTAATTSARWLRVRAVVVGTDGVNYYSEYSKPI
jgi:hypothetical protein